MGYVAVKGGTAAIEESIKKIKYERLKKERAINHKDIEAGMRSLVDQIMSEGSLYDEEIAAITLKQAEGSPEEAAFLIRAFRSTLSRKYYSNTVDTSDMFVERRISSGFKDIPGGQILGASCDYTHRLIDGNLFDEENLDISSWIENYLGEEVQGRSPERYPKVIDFLRSEGLIESVEEDETEPVDITKKSLQFPTVRSERLQILTRGQTGAVTAFGYAALRGYGAFHPTIGELRVGTIPVSIPNPYNESGSDDSYYIGDIRITEVEVLVPVKKEKDGKPEQKFEIGYGICFGQNETKAVAMGLLDQCLATGNEDYPTHDEEFVLYHIDSVESTGFISHLKLPHYVTFQSKLDSVRKSSAKDSVRSEVKND
jgi:alpha-D-ribose 1-methylphosphonate 5-triphosphate synthase subunit PhnI